MYKKFSKNALNYGGGPSFGTAQFSADLEKKKVSSSRDKLGLPGMLALRWRGSRACSRPGRGVPGHAGARARVSTGGLKVDSSPPLVPRPVGQALGTAWGVMYPRSQDAGGPVEAAGPRETPHVINPARYVSSPTCVDIYIHPPHHVVRHIYLPVGVKTVVTANLDVPIYIFPATVRVGSPYA